MFYWSHNCAVTVLLIITPHVWVAYLVTARDQGHFGVGKTSPRTFWTGPNIKALLTCYRRLHESFGHNQIFVNQIMSIKDRSKECERFTKNSYSQWHGAYQRGRGV